MKKLVVLLSFLSLLALAACGGDAAPAAATTTDTVTVTVYKSPTCGCCADWVAHLEEGGYDVKVEMVNNLTPVKQRFQVPRAMQSCHTALVDGYVVEGHVPMAEINRLLTERPDVVGLAVPGMPAGSPGMEVAGIDPQPYDVLTFDDAGQTEVFASYNE